MLKLQANNCVRTYSSIAKTLQKPIASRFDNNKSQQSAIVSTDEKGEEFRECFVKPKRKLNAQINLERMTGRAKQFRYPRFDIHDRLALRTPRSEEMTPSQDWPSVWPAAHSFIASVVPLPMRMGTRPDPSKRPPFKKVGNLELVKIPNFLHLTPEAIKRHCDAIKVFCTPFPKELIGKSELAEEVLPLKIQYSDYVHQGPSLRDSRAKKITYSLKVGALNLSKVGKEKLLRLVGDKYDERSDILTITTDRCFTRRQNTEYASYLLTVLLNESEKLEAWEKLKQSEDSMTVQFEDSKSKKNLEEMIECISKLNDDKTNWLKDINTLSEDEKFKTYQNQWSIYRNAPETQESIREYGENVKKLLGLHR
uniref:MRP-S28 domain-containing protein n=1 Tax=Rhabditophanes sp. KR3021 TaxID=114890 RepID=A0AC35UH47_9BILA